MINLNLILFHGLRCYLVGMGIGLVFYGEPMADFASPPNRS